MEDENFAQAFWLCAQSFAWTEDMPGLRLAEHLSAATGQGYRETSSLLRVALQAVCADFQPERYVKVCLSYSFAFDLDHSDMLLSSCQTSKPTEE